MPRTRMKKPAAPSAAPRPGPDPHRDERDARGEHQQDRVEDEPELRHGEVELALERREPDQERAAEQDLLDAHVAGRALRPHLAGEGRALHQQDHAAERRHRGAAEQQQVRRAPQRHVLAEDAVPDVVEREAGERDARADEDQHAAQRCLEPAGERQPGRAGLLGGEEDGEQAGEEHAEQPDEDEVVRGVGERARVAPRVEVRRDVPVHAEHRDQQRAGEHGERERAPRRQAGLALGVEAEGVQQLDPAGAVAEHEVEHRGGHDHRPDRAADHLAHRAAARGRRAGAALRQQCHRLV